MSEHTPAPWSVKESARGLWVTAPIRGRGIAGADIIADLPTCGAADGTTFALERARANARLIAGAPKMRAFIEMVANTHSEHWLAREAVALLREMDLASASAERSGAAS